MAIEMSTDARLGKDAGLRRYEDIRELLPNVDNPTPLVAVNHEIVHANADAVISRPTSWPRQAPSSKTKTPEGAGSPSSGSRVTAILG
jgi:hypothetical protein